MPHSQVLLSNGIHSSGARLGGTSSHGESHLAILLMIFITIQKLSNWGSKWRLNWFLYRTSPILGPDLSSGTSHTISVHVFHADPSAKCPFEAIGVVYESH